MSEAYDQRGAETDEDLIPVPVHIASSSADPVRPVAPEYSSCMSWPVDTIANLANGRPIRLLPRRYRRTQARIYITTLGALGTAIAGEGTVTSPAGANVAVASIAAGTILPGTYLITWRVALDGTVGATDINNFRLQQNPGGVSLMVATNDGVAGQYPQATYGPVTLNITNGIRVVTVAAGTVGAQYSAQIDLTPVLPADAATILLSSSEQGLMNNQGAQINTAPMMVEWKGQQACYACLAAGNTGGPVIVSTVDEGYEES